MGEPDEERQRKVRFYGRVQFKTIRHIADFSESEINDGWYCKKDFICMSDEVAEIAKLLAQGQEFYKGEELCIRGLEHLVEEDVADYRAEKMVASIDAVLDEQEEQLEANIYDPAIIAEIYAKIVTPLSREAYLVGLRDAKDGAAAAALIPDLSVHETKTEDEEVKQPNEQIEVGGEKELQEGGEKEPNEQVEEEEWKQPQEEGGMPEEDNEVLGMDVDESSLPGEVLESYGNSTLVADHVDDCGESKIVDDVDVQNEAVDEYIDKLKTDDTRAKEELHGSEQTCNLAFAEHEGEEKLNSSLHSMTMEVHPEKTITKAKHSGRLDSKVQNTIKKKSVPSEGTSREPPARKISKRKSGVDRKAGTEMSPFVFRRDGTIGFRNYDVEHRKREQSKQRKDCIKSALFTFLENEGEDEDFARFAATNEMAKKERRSKLYAASFPNKNKTQTKVSTDQTAATKATSTTLTSSSTGTSLVSPKSKLGLSSNSGVRGSVQVKKKNATSQGGWSKIVAKK
jgi:hypothetical protein